jgi:small-conductance mechanosensitive channel
MNAYLDQLPLQLIAPTILLIGAALVALLCSRWPIWLRLSFNIVVLLVLTFLIQRAFGSPFSPHFAANHMGDGAWEQGIEAGWWIIAARIAVEFTRLVVVLDSRPRETQFLSDLLVGLIYVAATLAIFSFALSLHISALLATSGVIAIVLGLALQSTLSDVFSGIAVGLERPFKPGDLLWIEGDIEGRVSQINWRSTHIITDQANIAIIPNSIIAKARILNRSEPTTRRVDSVTVRLDTDKETELCIATLAAAMKACSIPLAEPAPTIDCLGLNADGNEFEIRYSVSASDQIAPARTEIYGRVQRHLYHEGIGFAAAGIPDELSSEIPLPAKLLSRSDLFKGLDSSFRDVLAKHLTEVTFTLGEKLIEQGSTPDAMFIIASGTAEISVASEKGTRVLYRMSPGEVLGAIGLFTNSPVGSTATVTAPMRAYRLSKANVIEAMKETPGLAVGLEALAKCGKAALRRDAAEPEDAEVIQPEILLIKLRNFIHVLMSTR